MVTRDLSVSIEVIPETDIDGFPIGDPTDILSLLFEAGKTALTIPGPVGTTGVTRSSKQRAVAHLECTDAVRTQEPPPRTAGAFDGDRLRKDQPIHAPRQSGVQEPNRGFVDGVQDRFSDAHDSILALGRGPFTVEKARREYDAVADAAIVPNPKTEQESLVKTSLMPSTEEETIEQSQHDSRNDGEEDSSTLADPCGIENRGRLPGILTDTIRRTAHHEGTEGVLFKPTRGGASERLSNYHQ